MKCIPGHAPHRYLNVDVMHKVKRPTAAAAAQEQACLTCAKDLIKRKHLGSIVLDLRLVAPAFTTGCLLRNTTGCL
jgi:hypothetical protein